VVLNAGVNPADTFVLLYDVTDPPPPEGTGSPVNLVGIPAGDFSGGDGVLSAPFALTGVRDGSWLISALVDTDEDFHPLLTSNGGATCGDWGGAYLSDLSTFELGTVTVEGGERVEGLTVVVGSAVPYERPAFDLTVDVVSRDSEEMQAFVLTTTGVYSELVELTGPWDGTDSCDTVFLVHVVDDDCDGLPDPHPSEELAAAGFYETWPRIYLSFQGSDSVPLEEGESYVTEAPVYPDFLATGEVSVGVPTPRTELTAVFVGAALHTRADGTTEVVSGADLPGGEWEVSAISLTGQTWTVPNETAAYPTTDASFDPGGQGEGLWIE
jgi:hypothetical protein